MCMIMLLHVCVRGRIDAGVHMKGDSIVEDQQQGEARGPGGGRESEEIKASGGHDLF